MVRMELSTASALMNVVERGDGAVSEGHEGKEYVDVTIARQPSGAYEEEVCGVCLEVPEAGCFVELWCCGNVLCVGDAQQIGRCPFCREEPLLWDIVK